MKDDPIVEEVRQTRRRILEECGGDLDRLISRLKAAEARDRDRLVTMDDLAATACESEEVVADESSNKPMQPTGSAGG